VGTVLDMAWAFFIFMTASFGGECDQGIDCRQQRRDI
jgi:hypothetical protein